MKKLLLAVCLSLVGLAHAAPAPAPATIVRWADRCTNLTSSGWAFKGPRNFLQWLNVFGDPGIWLEFGQRSLDPHYYVVTLDSALDPAAPKNFLEWTDPNIYTQWGRALTTADFYNAAATTLFDGERLQRWLTLPLDPRLWRIATTAGNPATWLKWAAAPVQPETQDLAKKMLDPDTAAKWWGAVNDPKSYPGVKL